MTGTISPTGGASSVESMEMHPAGLPNPNRSSVNPACSVRAASIFRQATSLRFSGAEGHPVNSRHFLKEFRIYMRDLALIEDRDKIQAFEDYLIVDSPAEEWYLRALPTHLAGSWDEFQAAFLAQFPGRHFEEKTAELTKIKSVKFRQDAAVSAYIKVIWKDEGSLGETSPRKLSIDKTEVAAHDNIQNDTGTVGPTAVEAPSDEDQSKKLGTYKPIATEEIFVLADYGIPDGARVKFASHVWGIGGDYNSDEWFIHDTSSSKGVDFRQSGTAFKGWFNHTGKYDT